jgi:ElaB/YqjD/DUF883 family membrane-anchored ribosome-binding protein
MVYIDGRNARTARSEEVMVDKSKTVAASDAATSKDALERAREKFTEVAEKARQGGSAAKEKAARAGEAAKEKAARAGEVAKEKAARAGEAAKEKYGVAKENLKHGYDRVHKDMGKLTEDVNEYVRDNPGRSILIAAGIGFVVGSLLRGRRG